LRGKEITLLQAVLEEHRRAAERGQIEVSTSPFYHPILPLLCDTNIARESHPGVPLPRRRFHHPEDARDQLRAAIQQHERVFGMRPRGLWPSEGSVSEEALGIAAAEGFAWAASDEGVLSRSLGIGFPRHGDGTVAGGRELYRPRRLETSSGPITLFFRDHEISDQIGFVYSSVAPEAAAASLLNRIRQAGRSAGDQPAVVSVILDGENAWEFYPENGRPFLRAFYGLLASDREIRAVTASEAIQLCEPGTLPRLLPGSWINANFDVWIGAEEDNHAWDLLSDARDFLALHSAKPGLDTQAEALARQELWIAEGSDWCWWYGPEHSTANDEEFDWLYRKHLSNIYGLLGASPPDSLAVPLKRPRGAALNVPPSGEIRATVDGLVTNYFEWLGAGVYCPSSHSGSMHGPAPPVNAVYYGYDDEAFYLRVDFNHVFLQSNPHFELRLALQGSSLVRVQTEIVHGELHNPQYWKNDAAIDDAVDRLATALGRIYELRLARSLAGIADRTVRLQITVWDNSVPIQVIPQEGWLSFGTEIEQIDW
jgi:alpha-amylase/alpha-mannosidase (GH57 family)